MSERSLGTDCPHEPQATLTGVLFCACLLADAQSRVRFTRYSDERRERLQARALSPVAYDVAVCKSSRERLLARGHVGV